MNKEIFREMAKKWDSSIVCRQEIGRFTGGAVRPKTLANMDSQGEGPGGAFRIGSKVAYPIENVIVWLERRCRPIQDHE